MDGLNILSIKLSRVGVQMVIMIQDVWIVTQGKGIVLVRSFFRVSVSLHQASNMRAFGALLISTLVTLAIGENQNDQRFLGGIINGIFGGDSRCRNCEYDSAQANYCCKYNVDRRCCSHIAVGGTNQYPGNSPNDYPGYDQGSGSYYQKPGQCPQINYFGSNNNYRRQKREAPPNGGLSGRRYTGGYYGPNYGTGYSRPPLNDGGNSISYSRCYHDNECSGSQKCCSQYDGSRRCSYPTYYG